MSEHFEQITEIAKARAGDPRSYSWVATDPRPLGGIQRILRDFCSQSTETEKFAFMTLMFGSLHGKECCVPWFADPSGCKVVSHNDVITDFLADPRTDCFRFLDNDDDNDNEDFYAAYVFRSGEEEGYVAYATSPNYEGATPELAGLIGDLTLHLPLSILYRSADDEMYVASNGENRIAERL